MAFLTLVEFVMVYLWGWLILTILASVAAFLLLKKYYRTEIAVFGIVAVVGLVAIMFGPKIFPKAFEYPAFLTTFGPSDGPALPFKSAFAFLKNFSKMEKVENIARNPNDIPPPIERTYPEKVKINLTTKEVIAEVAPGTFVNYWTFNGTVPGPFLRVREGDEVELTLTNDPSSIHAHNIDLHAVNGPGGGAVLTNVDPGETKTFTFKALNPGLYVYHCAHPNVATHDTHGMYGLILVEPIGGLTRVDKEFYVMQGELYTTGDIGKKGLQIFDAVKMLNGRPEYIVFNGKPSALTTNVKAKVGDRVRFFVGNGGVNLISSFHIIGEIFDTVYPEASIGGALFKNVQTTIVPAGGAAITESLLNVPGKYPFVDHALARIERGAWGILEVTGEENPAVLSGTYDAADHSH
ncbi:MAG: copper-containing nitrite reductase [Patescibacteria group bacterium]